ncbi:unnamed protein product [Bursaphelenchus okinawaensis]|uniref:G_PROTEIN_RECEP_F1_2 domain-containing protein n=1 Tax=Bursaphelenchus okinawaensis TaxID=465554 RepID=A0A811LF92_9BILA|nr:unnamed protein product [Bursaphelenchus okinawaensis]CAG9121931.1 unnamed protein product [Bursaphelenchus okinawaensis]
MSITLNNITYPECPQQPPPVSIGYAIFSQFVNGFLTSICVAVGTVGNFYSVRSVKLSNFDKNSNRGVTLAFSIVTLAIWDSILLWFAFFYYGFKNLVHAEYLSFVNIFTPYMHGCSQVANTASIWCVVAITVQRYMATRDPFRTTRWLLHITSAELKEYAPIRSSLR